MLHPIGQVAGQQVHAVFGQKLAAQGAVRPEKPHRAGVLPVPAVLLSGVFHGGHLSQAFALPGTLFLRALVFAAAVFQEFHEIPGALAHRLLLDLQPHGVPAPDGGFEQGGALSAHGVQQGGLVPERQAGPLRQVDQQPGELLVGLSGIFQNGVQAVGQIPPFRRRHRPQKVPFRPLKQGEKQRGPGAAGQCLPLQGLFAAKTQGRLAAHLSFRNGAAGQQQADLRRRRGAGGLQIDPVVARVCQQQILRHLALWCCSASPAFSRTKLPKPAGSPWVKSFLGKMWAMRTSV